MTLILGLNLSDRLYIAGDTRVTFPDGSFQDEVIKVASLQGEPFYLVGETFKDPIYIAVAGHIDIATYFFKKIKAAIRDGSLPNDIRLLFKEIEEFIKNQYGEWLMGQKPYRKCCLIFGGSFVGRKKQISTEMLEKLQNTLKANVPSAEVLEMRKNQLLQNPLFQEIIKIVPEEKWMRPFKEPEAMCLNPLIEEAIKNHQTEIEAPDSLIFSVQLKDSKVEVEKAEWGEFLAYGQGEITKTDLPADLLATMELNPGQLVNKKDMTEGSRISDCILKIAQERKLQGIGGTVTPTVIRNGVFDEIFEFNERKHIDGNLVLVESVYSSPRGFHHFKKDSGTKNLHRFHLYSGSSTEAEL